MKWEGAIPICDGIIITNGGINGLPICWPAFGPICVIFVCRVCSIRGIPILGNCIGCGILGDTEWDDWVDSILVWISIESSGFGFTGLCEVAADVCALVLLFLGASIGTLFIFGLNNFLFYFYCRFCIRFWMRNYIACFIWTSS